MHGCCRDAEHLFLALLLYPLPFPTPPFPAPPGVPYDLSPEFVEQLFTKHKIDYIIHGDDPCLMPDGTDAYAHAKKLGRFKMVRQQRLVCRGLGRFGCACDIWSQSAQDTT